MNYFIIGDIHGCYFTLTTLLKHWNPKEEFLISVGDLIDRGNYTPKVLKLCMQLSVNYPESTCFLKGNHEVEMAEYLLLNTNVYWFRQGGDQSIEQLRDEPIDNHKLFTWISTMPLVYQTKSIFVSHAGLSHADNPFDELNMDGIVWNRNLLKNIGKIQVHGHTALKQSGPIYTKASHSWNIDTGCVYGNGLTGLVLDEDGEFIKKHFIETDSRDIE